MVRVVLPIRGLGRMRRWLVSHRRLILRERDRAQTRSSISAGGLGVGVELALEGLMFADFAFLRGWGSAVEDWSANVFHFFGGNGLGVSS